MGIQLTTDIVMDVVKAGNPARTQKITSNLKALGSGFSQAMSQEGALGAANGLAYASTSSIGLQNATALTKTSAAVSSPAATAHRRFESMVLSQFVQSMLPSKAAAVYGSGNAGQIWKSMLAEKVADQVAKHGGIGIADRIASAQARLTPSASAAAPSLPVVSATSSAA
ncbi:rod-binding protein [Roseixanthobacter pseudopolyaromaticivorans]|uniref:rod-binding protein n=1 Tax=Xanthobacteraceae TaxID=335928 RepID=UPI0037291143